MKRYYNVNKHIWLSELKLRDKYFSTNEAVMWSVYGNRHVFNQTTKWDSELSKYTCCNISSNLSFLESWKRVNMFLNFLLIKVMETIMILIQYCHRIMPKNKIYLLTGKNAYTEISGNNFIYVFMSIIFFATSY